jgi:hypothetical protein
MNAKQACRALGLGHTTPHDNTDQTNRIDMKVLHNPSGPGPRPKHRCSLAIRGPVRPNALSKNHWLISGSARLEHYYPVVDWAWLFSFKPSSAQNINATKCPHPSSKHIWNMRCSLADMYRLKEPLRQAYPWPEIAEIGRLSSRSCKTARYERNRLTMPRSNQST